MLNRINDDFYYEKIKVENTYKVIYLLDRKSLYLIIVVP